MQLSQFSLQRFNFSLAHGLILLGACWDLNLLIDNDVFNIFISLKTLRLSLEELTLTKIPAGVVRGWEQNFSIFLVSRKMEAKEDILVLVLGPIETAGSV
jgi:hypothetical protein